MDVPIPQKTYAAMLLTHYYCIFYWKMGDKKKSATKIESRITISLVHSNYSAFANK